MIAFSVYDEAYAYAYLVEILTEYKLLVDTTEQHSMLFKIKVDAPRIFGLLVYDFRSINFYF